jgi:nucleoside-diphosphate-sugar epimerase
MRVLVAGATGVLGRPLLPLLTSVGHEVIAFGRPGGRTAGVTGPGVSAVLADPFDHREVAKAVRNARPDAVVHLLTSIPAELNLRRIGRDFAVTNRLRSETTRYLLDAAADVGASRVISQGVAFVYDPDAPPKGEPANEDTPLWQQPPASFQTSMDALKTLERLTREAGGLVLRFGQLYGPGSAFAPDGLITQMVRKRQFPLVGGGHATFSFTHPEDAATAVVAALDRDVAGVLNIVDDTPVAIRDWAPAVADLLGARAPRNVPTALARLLVGSWGVALMTKLRGADNARAKLMLDWRPRYADWRTGFAAELAPIRGVPAQPGTRRAA